MDAFYDAVLRDEYTVDRINRTRAKGKSVLGKCEHTSFPLCVYRVHHNVFVPLKGTVHKGAIHLRFIQVLTLVYANKIAHVFIK